MNGPRICAANLPNPSKTPVLLGFCVLGESGSGSGGGVIRENRAPNPKISEKFQAKTPMDAGFCGGVDGVWKNRR
jgi:hypothetical protein